LSNQDFILVGASLPYSYYRDVHIASQLVFPLDYESLVDSAATFLRPNESCGILFIAPLNAL
jgi:hypothetical protein